MPVAIKPDPAALNNCAMRRFTIMKAIKFSVCDHRLSPLQAVGIEYAIIAQLAAATAKSP
jgi:hypothetical protein